MAGTGAAMRTASSQRHASWLDRPCGSSLYARLLGQKHYREYQGKVAFMKAAMTTRKSLAALLFIVTITCAVVASGATASPQGVRATSTTLSIGLQQGYNGLPFFVAVRHGFFKKAGITDVKFSLFNSLPAMLTAVAQGQLDMGSQAIPAVLAYNRATSGAKVKIVAPSTSGSTMFFARNNSGIPVATPSNWKSTVLAWKGKKVGIPVPNGLLALYVRYFVKEAGMQQDDVQTVVVGVGPPAVAALENGLVDVISGDALTLGLLKGFGKNILGFPLKQGPSEFRNSLAGVLFTSETAIQENRAKYVAFTNGLAQARKFIANPKNKKAVLDILTRKIGLKPDEAALVYPHAVVTYGGPTTSISRRSMGLTLSTLLKSNVITGPLPAYDFLVADFAK